jgi:hypothetical protein
MSKRTIELVVTISNIDQWDVEWDKNMDYLMKELRLDVRHSISQYLGIDKQDIQIESKMNDE